MTDLDRTEFVGLSPEELTLPQRQRAHGLWAAFVLYDPVTLPLRKIEAIGRSAADVWAQIAAAGNEVSRYEVVRLHFLR